MTAPAYTLNGEPIDLQEFLAANSAPEGEPLDLEDVEALLTMKPGQEMHLGGGAAAEFVVRCEARRRDGRPEHYVLGVGVHPVCQVCGPRFGCEHQAAYDCDDCRRHGGTGP